MSDFHPWRFYIYITLTKMLMLITSLNLRIKRRGARKWFDGEMTVNLAFLLACVHRVCFFDVLLFHVRSTVPFFSKLVIPVHVSMEEPVLKTKAEKSTSVNVVVDGEETIAKKRRLQVPSKFRNVLHYTFVAFKKYRDLHRPHIKVLSSIYHT